MNLLLYPFGPPESAFQISDPTTFDPADHLLKKYHICPGITQNDLFSHGTYAIAKSISGCNGYTVVGGGDSVAAINLLNLNEDSYSHICTGGGASLEYLSTGKLPGIDVLKTEC